MFVIRYSTKDLTIQARGGTVEEALEKVKRELEWYRNRFPFRKYPKTPRKYSVRSIEE